MSTPASRTADSRTCPIHGATAFVVGTCAPEVLVSGLKAVRYTDGCPCAVAHTSPLAEGAAMVLINGMPAGRVGAKTLDGGEIVQGDASVLIGGDTFSVPSFISIHGEPDFQAKVLRDLYLISCTPSGKKLLASLMAAGHRIDIELGTKEDDGAHRGLTRTVPSWPEKGNEPFGHNDARAFDGTGIGSVVKYDPDMSTEGYPVWGKPPNYTSDVTLFHELTHADSAAHGTTPLGDCDNRPSVFRRTCRCAERRVMGLPPYDNEGEYPFSENSYRRDRGYMPAPVY